MLFRVLQNRLPSYFKTNFSLRFTKISMLLLKGKSRVLFMNHSKRFSLMLVDMGVGSKEVSEVYVKTDSRQVFRLFTLPVSAVYERP